MNTRQPEAGSPWAEMTQIKFLLFTVSLIIIDQFSKYIVRHSGGFYICNPGIAFGIKIPEILFWIIYAIIIISIFCYFLKKYRFKITSKSQIQKPKYFILYALYFILILSGAFSNLIDRLRYGCVIDFIDLKFWPVFNLADAFITIGGIMIVVKILNPKH